MGALRSDGLSARYGVGSGGRGPGVKAQQLAKQTGRRLRAVVWIALGVAVTNRDVEHPVGTESQIAADVQGAGHDVGGQHGALAGGVGQIGIGGRTENSWTRPSTFWTPVLVLSQRCS